MRDIMEKNFTEEQSFISYIADKEDSSMWIETPVKEIRIDVSSDSDSKYVAELQTDEASSCSYELRDISEPSLLERARVSGYSIGSLTREDYSYIVTKCLATADNKTMCKVRVKDDKIGAFLSSSYKDIPIPEVFEAAGRELHRNFDGKFSTGYWSYPVTTATYTVDNSSLTYEYTKILSKRGYSISDLTCNVTVSASDCGYSGCNIYPQIIAKTGGGKLVFPILGSIILEHKGKADINAFSDNIPLAFAQAEKSLSRLQELEDIVLNYPFNALCNCLNAIHIGKKSAKSVLEQYAIVVGNEGYATAADLYFKASEIAPDASKNCQDKLTIDESIAKILKFSDKQIAGFDSPLCCWKYNI